MLDPVRGGVTLFNSWRFLAIASGFLWLLSSTVHGDDWTVPIAANSPQVVLSLTDERKQNDTDFFAVTSPAAGGRSLPI